MKIALVGDYDASVMAHRAIPRAIGIAARALATPVETTWLHSNEVNSQMITGCDALWCVPLSPYANPEAVIAMIAYARERDLPFLGTCAGYQHAVLEYARNELGCENAASSEDCPTTSMPLISALSCRLADQADTIYLESGSRLAEIYKSDKIIEEYNCGFGVNREYLPLFAASGLDFCAYDDAGDPRAFEVNGHRFFIGTAYQPERSSLHDNTHPLITAFLTAVL